MYIDSVFNNFSLFDESSKLAASYRLIDLIYLKPLRQIALLCYVVTILPELIQLQLSTIFSWGSCCFI